MSGIRPKEPTEYDEKVLWTPEGNLISVKLVLTLVFIIKLLDPEHLTYWEPLLG